MLSVVPKTHGAILEEEKDIHIVLNDLEKARNKIPRKVLRKWYREEISLYCLHMSKQREHKIESQKVIPKV